MLQLLIHESPISFGWMTETGFCYGDYQIGSTVNLVHKYTILPYVKIQRGGKKETDCIPLSACHSDNHIFILYSDCFTVISKITNNIIHTNYFSNENFTQMLYDKHDNSLWLLSSKGLSQIELFRENDNLWADYLEKMDYKKALEHSVGLPDRHRKIGTLLANDLFNKGDYQNASIQYGLSDAKFEEVCLKFLRKNQYEALKNYLNIIDSELLDESNLTQKFLISTWYVEILLNELNSETNQDEIETKSKTLINYMKEKEKYLDKDTVYQLLQHYGQVREFLEFAEIKMDYEAIILHHINEKNIKEALDKLQKFAEERSSEKREEIKKIFTTYSHSFMKYEPDATIELLTSKLTNLYIDPNKIISALMNTEKQNDPKIRKYLGVLIENESIKEKNIHNLYIYYLSKEITSNKDLIEYLKKPLRKTERVGYNKVSKKREVLFELDYAKRLFSKNYPALALVLALMEKYSEAVKTALEHNEIEIAEFIAQNVDDQKMQKILWLDIFTASNAKGENQNDFSKALEIMKKSKILKIEDVLPRIMDNIKIEEFKEQISSCIDVYETNIENLKKDISEYNKTAENIKSDIYKVKKQSIEVQYKNLRCEICNNSIKDDNIFLFPCGHLFDGSCLMKKLLEYEYLESMKTKCDDIRKIKMVIGDLEIKKNTQKPKEKQQGGFFANVFGKEKQSEMVATITQDELTMLEDYKNMLNNILSEECALCGKFMVESTQYPFQGDKTEWIFS